MLKARVLTALVLLAGFLSALFWLPQALWLVFTVLLVGAAAREWGRLAGLTPTLTGVLIALLAVTLFAVASDDRLARAICVAASLFWVLMAPGWLRFQWRLTGAAHAWAGFALLLPAGLAFVKLREAGPFVLLGFMVLVWVADSAAYFAGRAFGRHKLAPSISPGKTWEGVAGAVLAVLGVGWLLNKKALALGLPALNPQWLLPQLLLITAVSIIGDLFESMLKRQAGVKDSGSMLPGHGGVLDRLDSLISTLPLAFTLLSLT